MNIAINGTQLLIGIGILAIGLIATIAIYRYYFSTTSASLKEMPTWIKKYPSVDAFQWSPVFLRLGLIFSLSAASLAFSYTTYEPQINLEGCTLILPDIIEINEPPVVPPPATPPPPPPPVIEELPAEEEIEDPIFEDMTVEAETINEPPPVIKKKPAPIKRKKVVPKPKKVEIIIDKIFEVVEQMPRFPGCEDMAGDTDAKKQCSDKKMLEFIYKCIKYPMIARDNGVEGVVVIRFVVDKEGKIVNPTILRDIGGGCGEEALRVVQKMNDLPQRWTPGKQRNNAVSVQFNLPVRFKLN